MKTTSPYARPTLGAQIHAEKFRGTLDGTDVVVTLNGETDKIIRAQKALEGTPHGVQVFVAREQIVAV